MRSSAPVLARELRVTLPDAAITTTDGAVRIAHGSSRYMAVISWDVDPAMEASSVGTALMMVDSDGEALADFPRAAWSQVMLPGTRGRVDFRPAARAIADALSLEEVSS